MYHWIEAIWIFQDSRWCLVMFWSFCSVWLLARECALSCCLLCKVRCFVNLWFFEYFSFDSVWIKLNVETPLLDLFACCNHSVQFANWSNTVMGLLEKTLAHGGHSFFIFTHFLRNSDKHAEFWWQINILTFLLDLKERLVKVHDLFIILLLEIKDHRNCCSGFALLKLACWRAHIKPYIADFIRLMVAIASHHNSSFKFVVDRLLNLVLFWLFVWVPLPLLNKSGCLLINELKTVVNWQIFWDIVNNQIKSALEYPGRCEKTWPRLDRVVKRLGLGWHKETRISANLAQLWVSHLGFDDWVNEIQSKGMVFHLHWVKIIQSELRYSLNCNRKFSAKVSLLSFKVNSFIQSGCWEDIISDTNIVNKDTFELSRMSS